MIMEVEEICSLCRIYKDSRHHRVSVMVPTFPASSQRGDDRKAGVA